MLISQECVFPPILHGSISQFDILLHGQLASHNAQSATEPGVRGHTRSQSGRERRRQRRRQRIKNEGMWNGLFQDWFSLLHWIKDNRNFCYYYYYK